MSDLKAVTVYGPLVQHKGMLGVFTRHAQMRVEGVETPAGDKIESHPLMGRVIEIPGGKIHYGGLSLREFRRHFGAVNQGKPSAWHVQGVVHSNQNGTQTKTDRDFYARPVNVL